MWYLRLAMVGLVAAIGLHQCALKSECEEKHCEHGSPMLVRDQAKVVGFPECVCVERSK